MAAEFQGTKVKDMSSARRAFLKTTAVIVVVAISGGGCDGDTVRRSSTGSGTARDSARIPLIRNSESGTWNDETRWTVQSELEIGLRDGPAEYLFGRVVDVDAGRDGRIYVLDNQAAKVSVFDSAGRFAFSFGGLGQGPGEFSIGAFAILVEESGTVTVRDGNNRRDNLFRADGHFLRSRPLAGPFREWAALPQGGYVTRSRSAAWDGIVRLDGDARILDNVLAFEYDIPRSRGAVASGPGPSAGAKKEIPLLPALPVWGVTSDGRIISGISDRYRIEVRQPDGSLTMIVEREHEPRLIRPEDRARLMDHLKELMRAEGLTDDAIAGVFQRFAYTLPDSFPAFADLTGGPDGTIWAQGVLPIDSMPANSTLDALHPGSSVWDVFSREGRYLGQVNMPPGFTLKRIRGYNIYGIETDELGLQQVVRLKISR